MSAIERIPLEIQAMILSTLDDRNSLRRATIASRELMAAYMSDKVRILGSCPPSTGHLPATEIALTKVLYDALNNYASLPKKPTMTNIKNVVFNPTVGEEPANPTEEEQTEDNTGDTSSTPPVVAPAFTTAAFGYSAAPQSTSGSISTASPCSLKNTSTAFKSGPAFGSSGFGKTSIPGISAVSKTGSTAFGSAFGSKVSTNAVSGFGALGGASISSFAASSGLGIEGLSSTTKDSFTVATANEANHKDDPIARNAARMSHNQTNDSIQAFHENMQADELRLAMQYSKAKERMRAAAKKIDDNWKYEDDSGDEGNLKLDFDWDEESDKEEEEEEIEWLTDGRWEDFDEALITGKDKKNTAERVRKATLRDYLRREIFIHTGENNIDIGILAQGVVEKIAPAVKNIHAAKAQASDIEIIRVWSMIKDTSQSILHDAFYPRGWQDRYVRCEPDLLARCVDYCKPLYISSFQAYHTFGDTGNKTDAEVVNYMIANWKLQMLTTAGEISPSAIATAVSLLLKQDGISPAVKGVLGYRPE
ncbi:hypothetical protein EJ08DRAFT_735092 [Tothia fuscella]|uniref:Uncharacterized protein n=1 Tax=Tothia fuscella TaxID=1048955 RepID=A0A9P4NPK8_9PEZI|nr:hypothetical protein EJ08DRAFT_735092 [Tothia fuscella]